MLGIIQQAARTQPELAALWDQIAERRAANMRRFVAHLATVTPLRLDPDEAADIVWATNAVELYQLLAGQRGWSTQRYERFLADTWRRLLLAEQNRHPPEGATCPESSPGPLLTVRIPKRYPRQAPHQFGTVSAVLTATALPCHPSLRLRAREVQGV